MSVDRAGFEPAMVPKDSGVTARHFQPAQSPIQNYGYRRKGLGSRNAGSGGHTGSHKVENSIWAVAVCIVGTRLRRLKKIFPDEDLDGGIEAWYTGSSSLFGDTMPIDQPNPKPTEQDIANYRSYDSKNSPFVSCPEKFLKVGQRVRAKFRIFDLPGRATDADWGWVSAEAGEEGTVIHVEKGYWPTVRFDNTRCATCVTDGEVVPL